MCMCFLRVGRSCREQLLKHNAARVLLRAEKAQKRGVPGSLKEGGGAVSAAGEERLSPDCPIKREACEVAAEVSQSASLGLCVRVCVCVRTGLKGGWVGVPVCASVCVPVCVPLCVCV